MAASRRRVAPSARRRRPPPGPATWWGKGAPPHERWPGATIRFSATWSRARRRWETHAGRYYFDPDAAAKAEDFFPTFLIHHIGEYAGQSFELMDYQRLLLTRPIFGWRRASDGRRRFRKVLAFIPKGAGKSPWGSGTGLYLALCDDEPGAEVYSVASDKEQAKVVHETAKIMVEQSADLAELCEITRDSIYCSASRSFYKALSADASGKHGFRPHGVILDELHAQPNRDLLEALERAMVKRRQPLIILLSHAGDDDEGVCFEEYEYAKRVLSGTIEDETYLPVIFEADPQDDWRSPSTWTKANPATGLTVKVDALETACRAAQNEPRKLNDFLRFNLNRWVNQATAWIPIDWWDACAGQLDEAALRGLTCAAGLDMAQKIDLAAFVITFRQFLDGQVLKVEVAEADELTGQEQKRELSLNYRLFMLPFFWLPEETVRDREREGFSAYRTWAEAGLLTITDGASIDYDRVYRDIVEKIVPRFPLLKQGEIGYDPAFATDIAARLRDKAGLQTIEILQNYKYMTEPAHIFEALVKERRVIHNGHRILRWNVENVAIKRDEAGRIRPVKPKRNTKKVDGVVAGLMGIHRLNAQQPTPPPQDYTVEWAG